MLFAIFAAAAMLALPASALDNGVGRTPVLGFNSCEWTRERRARLRRRLVRGRAARAMKARRASERTDTMRARAASPAASGARPHRRALPAAGRQPAGSRPPEERARVAPRLVD